VGYLKETAYAVDSQFSRGEAAAASTKCNRDAMRGDAFRKKNTWCERIVTHKPVSNPPGKGVHGSAKLDWVTLWFLGWKVNSTMSPTSAL
jgi:hypothetical protein